MTLDLIVNGVANGASVAIFAAAFYLVYCIARTFHIALAGVYALAPFLFWALHQKGFGAATSLLMSVAFGALVSVLCEGGNHVRLRRRGASAEAHLLSSLGIYVVIVQILLLLWGPDVRLLRTGLEPAYVFADIEVRRTQLIAIGTAAMLLAPLWGVLRWTRWGIALRALRDNPTELALLGFNDGRIRVVLFAVAGGYASIAALVASLDGGFQAHYGFPNLLLAVVATLSVRGEGVGLAVFGGVALGVLRTLCVWSLGARWQDTLSYALFAIALLLQSQSQARRDRRGAQ